MRRIMRTYIKYRFPVVDEIYEGVRLVNYNPNLIVNVLYEDGVEFTTA